MWLHLSLIFLLGYAAFSAELGENQNNFNKINPINFKLTKLTNIELDGGMLDFWNRTVKNILQSQIPENTGEIETQVFTNEDQNPVSKRYNPSYVLQNSRIENEEVNYKELCKRMVGVSKPQICKVTEDIKSSGIPKNCKEIQESGQNKSGIYKIQPKPGIKPLFVLCDMDTSGGGWIHIQKRFDGSEDFYREWRDYKFGFGDLDGELWIGLENIYQMTRDEGNELLIEITDNDNIKKYAHYKAFGIGSEIQGYYIKTLSGFFGDAGDSLTSEHLNSKFTTKDFDQDIHASNCAQLYLGGWWYKACHYSNLNGKFIGVTLPKAHEFQGLHWISFKGHNYCHSGSRMLIRPAQP